MTGMDISSPPRHPAELPAGLLALDVALALAVVAWQKMPAGGLGPAALRAWAVAGAAAVLAGLALVVLRRAWRDVAARRAARLAGVANAAGLLLALVAAEALLRAVAVPDAASGGLRVGPAVLPPTWAELRARNAALVARRGPGDDGWLGYVVPDALLGWTVGPSRSTPDGVYHSSAEGIRSAGPGVRFAGTRPALRVALVGDSYTFSMDGPYADSWGAQLEALLGPGAQVLNFGVDGYGVDQAWLRFMRDVRPWRPDVVLFGLIQHDVHRTAAVYPFLSFGWDYPFAKPRFALADGRLQLLNVPLPAPGDLAALGSADDLPFARWDLGYRRTDWRWRAGDPPLAGRLLGAAFPRWPPAPPEVSHRAAAAVSAALLAQFLQVTAAAGTPARILYFPSRGAGDFGREATGESRIARRMLADYAIPHLDLAPCLAGVPADAVYRPGMDHYGAAANGAVARCVARELGAMGVRGAPGGAGGKSGAGGGT